MDEENEIQKLKEQIRKMQDHLEDHYLEQIARYKVIIREYEQDISMLKKEIYSLRENLPTKRHEQIERANPWHCVFCGALNPLPCNDYLCMHCQKIRPFMTLTSTLVKCGCCSKFNFALANFCEWCGDTIRTVENE
ncbi:hypothetical protein [Candidatus Uabimicrobium amorphum]|uniref:Uncharacterized protein n=1 Tax=Uabimicrobium amorphum TaxID=2596890 RepID=A0A5S9ISR4_UABAM|nr:hypothetical protein [Candidatus Uabimicrobium amorphum]BBM86460.1 hypothetical protein UABAM_04846 [Candidatus Uabimicrobium amorphum]